jgi:acyl carrier protein
MTVETKLIECFAGVFPELDRRQIPNASVDSLAEWDSLASLTLVAVVEEEFGIVIDDLELSELGSFAAFHDYLHALGPSKRASSA